MTRIAVIADVHGDAPALDAVLEEIERESPDLVVLAGDAAGGLWQDGSPRSDDETMTSLTPEADLREMLGGTDAPLVVCGHTHVQYDRVVSRTRIVNTGSVGMPFQGPPGAFWLMLHPEPELRRTDYDIEATAGRIRASDYWDAGNAASQLLDPPDPRELEELYERSRVRR